MNHTQSSALTYLHNQMDDLLADYADAKINAAFFINQINDLLNKLEVFIKENRTVDKAYKRSTKIHKSFFRVG